MYFEPSHSPVVRVRVRCNRGDNFITSVPKTATVSQLANRALSIYLEFSKEAQTRRQTEDKHNNSNEEGNSTKRVKEQRLLFHSSHQKAIQFTVASVKQGSYWIPKSQMVGHVLADNEEVQIDIVKARPRYPYTTHIQKAASHDAQFRTKLKMLEDQVNNEQQSSSQNDSSVSRVQKEPFQMTNVQLATGVINHFGPLTFAEEIKAQLSTHKRHIKRLKKQQKVRLRESKTRNQPDLQEGRSTMDNKSTVGDKLLFGNDQSRISMFKPVANGTTEKIDLESSKAKRRRKHADLQQMESEGSSAQLSSSGSSHNYKDSIIQSTSKSSQKAKKSMVNDSLDSVRADLNKIKDFLQANLIPQLTKGSNGQRQTEKSPSLLKDSRKLFDEQQMKSPMPACTVLSSLPTFQGTEGINHENSKQNSHFSSTPSIKSKKSQNLQITPCLSELVMQQSFEIQQDNLASNVSLIYDERNADKTTKESLDNKHDQRAYTRSTEQAFQESSQAHSKKKDDGSNKEVNRTKTIFLGSEKPKFNITDSIQPIKMQGPDRSPLQRPQDSKLDCNYRLPQKSPNQNPDLFPYTGSFPRHDPPKIVFENGRKPSSELKSGTPEIGKSPSLKCQDPRKYLHELNGFKLEAKPQAILLIKKTPPVQPMKSPPTQSAKASSPTFNPNEVQKNLQSSKGQSVTSLSHVPQSPRIGHAASPPKSAQNNLKKSIIVTEDSSDGQILQQKQPEKPSLNRRVELEAKINKFLLDDD